MILVGYRHGLRVSELVDLRWDQVDFGTATLHVRRVKQVKIWDESLLRPPDDFWPFKCERTLDKKPNSRTAPAPFEWTPLHLICKQQRRSEL
jgi:integrase